jgi:hypothetical protein
MQEIEHTRSTYEHSQGAVAIQGEKVQGDTNMVRKSSRKGVLKVPMSQMHRVIICYKTT